MACSCKNKTTDGLDIPHTIRPEEPCVFCAEKHFSTAWALARENGYENVNRAAIHGEIVLAQWHVWQKDRPIAEELRDLRHLIQNRKENEIGDKWTEIAEKFDKLITAENENLTTSIS